MDTRREFLKKSLLLSGAAGISGVLPASIQRALAIDPKVGSTYLDAEHIVILMQENRSFDHCFGTLQGVRGFNDPRAITLPDQNLVWLQTNAAGETYAPFRFDIRDTKVTWMGSLPHSRSSQVDAHHLGKYDQWLNAKRSGHPQYAGMPLTLGHYSREDVPFNYVLADAFTICDENFCSAMTSTWPNRLFFWTGTIREQQNGQSTAHVRNDLHDGEARWMTFPERLEANGVSWRVYQNDISCGGGFTGEERAWLANFGCNPLEWFANYNVKFSSRYVQGLQQQTESLPGEISELEAKLRATSSADPAYKKLQAALAKKQEVLDDARKGLAMWSRENYDKLSGTDKELYQKAFTINSGDPFYHDITPLDYEDGDNRRQVFVPKGDILHQFRQDVDNGRLPMVSWLVGPGNFSDHPSAPWYGSWYVSEILDILTRNPEVWKKTIFILAYDENDGYFDHVPPYVAPDPLRPETGKCSPGIDTDVEFIRRDQEIQEGIGKKEAREGPIGLGYRVPLIIASPWSRGGQVCSQVFDHTSTLKFLEVFLNNKLGKNIKEDNISEWRRTITGDLTAVFKPYNGEKPAALPFLKKDPFIEKIYNAKFKKDPADFRPLSSGEIAQINRSPSSSPRMPRQETGMRPSCALPYELYADGKLSDGNKRIELTLSAKDEVFGKRSAGSPFNVYFPTRYRSQDKGNTSGAFEMTGSRSYAVKAGDSLTDSWPVQAFEQGIYHLRVYGPNGFFRELKGDANDPAIAVACEYERQAKKLSGNIALKITNLDPRRAYAIEIRDNAYKNPLVRKMLESAGSSKDKTVIILALSKSFCWYDFSLQVNGFSHFEKRYAGRVETGKAGFTDPAMGGVEG